VESIVPQPLTAQRFAPFGDVIEARQSSALMINQGTSTRFHDLAAVDVGAEGGRTLVNIFRATPYPLPLVIRMMEKHPLRHHQIKRPRPTYRFLLPRGTRG
jgi:ureidoglycolate lyase